MSKKSTKLVIKAKPTGKIQYPPLGDMDAGQVVFLIDTPEGITGYALVVNDDNGHLNETNEIAVLSLDDNLTLLLFPHDTPVRMVAATLEIEE